VGVRRRGHKPTETGLPFHDEAAKIDDTYLTGKVAYAGSHPFIDHFRFVQALEDDKCVAKLTIPAPAQFFEQFAMPFNLEATRRYYKPRTRSWRTTSLLRIARSSPTSTPRAAATCSSTTARGAWSWTRTPSSSSAPTPPASSA
jgi:hypothetical protein